MPALHQTVKRNATSPSDVVALQSQPMSEKLIRLERLIAILDARGVPKRSRSRYLFERGGDTTFAHWSNVLSGKGSFGASTARRLEEMLRLAPFALEEHGLPPDAASIAGAFNALPLSTPEDVERRRTLYVAIMAMLQVHSTTDTTPH